jgi:hypothetical protein
MSQPNASLTRGLLKKVGSQSLVQKIVLWLLIGRVSLLLIARQVI